MCSRTFCILQTKTRLIEQHLKRTVIIVIISDNEYKIVKQANGRYNYVMHKVVQVEIKTSSFSLPLPWDDLFLSLPLHVGLRGRAGFHGQADLGSVSGAVTGAGPGSGDLPETGRGLVPAGRGSKPSPTTLLWGETKSNMHIIFWLSFKRQSDQNDWTVKWYSLCGQNGIRSQQMAGRGRNDEKCKSETLHNESDVTLSQSGGWRDNTLCHFIYTSQKDSNIFPNAVLNSPAY